MKYCPCVEGKGEEEYIKCPFYGLEKCPCHPNDCIVYRIYENGESTRAAFIEISEMLRARFGMGR